MSMEEVTKKSTNWAWAASLDMHKAVIGDADLPPPLDFLKEHEKREKWGKRQKKEGGNLQMINPFQTLYISQIGL